MANLRLFLGLCAATFALTIAPACAHGDGGGAAAEKVAELSTEELENRARERELGDEDYPYHDQPREIDGEPDCPDIKVVEYEGKVIDYNRPIEVNKHFRKRLTRFEKIVRDVAKDVYGKAPDKIVHAGGHHCKSVGGRGEKLSEHAFGHAIDVSGFVFEDGAGVKGVGKEQADGFEVRLEEHWNGKSGFDKKHRTFLRRLVNELKVRGPFSTMLGPEYPGHDKFFHLDFGPEFFFRI